MSKVVPRLIFRTKPISQIESSASAPRVCTLWTKRTKYSSLTKFPDLILFHQFNWKSFVLIVTLWLKLYWVPRLGFQKYWSLLVLLKSLLWFILKRNTLISSVGIETFGFLSSLATTLRWQIQTKSLLVANITEGNAACRQLLFSFCLAWSKSLVFV